MYYERGMNIDKKVQKLIKSCIKGKIVKSEDEICALLGAVTVASASNYLVCTNNDLIYMTTGGILFKSNLYPFSSITAAVNESKSALKSVLSITIGGGQKVILDVNATRNEREELVKFINRKIAAPAPNSGISQLSVADELKKFKELLDMGVITQEEFESKKKRLLNS